MTEVSVKTWAGFAVMCIGMFMAILDVQIVATSLPNIQSTLGIRPEQMSWIQTAYLIAEVIAIPLTGFLTRLLSMRWLFVIAVALFTTASIGCATSHSFAGLVAWRIVQGFSGGTLIPAVFSAVFLFFPFRLQGIATTIAGVLAVLAPTVGPVIGGWITETYSWHWLFFVNAAPGIVSALAASAFLPKDKPDFSHARSLDIASLFMLVVMLTSLEIGLKEAPQHGWLSALVLGLLAAAMLFTTAFARRSLNAHPPLVELRTLAERNFAIGCGLSFVLGIGLFGSTYLMPVFLAFVRDHDALEIGKIMLVTGLAQLFAAPVAVALERRVDPRLLTAIGFALFATGQALSGFQTTQADFHDMLLPQIVRGVAIMFCLLPPTRLALGHLAPAQIPDASGLFNLMRNLGGAIGIALIDTVIYGRAPIHAQAIIARLKNGDVETAKRVGIPVSLFLEKLGKPIDADTQATLSALVERLSLTQAINEAWLMIALLTLAALACLPFTQHRPNEPIKNTLH